MKVFGYEVDWLTVSIVLLIAMPFINALLKRKVTDLKDRNELSLVFGKCKSLRKVSYENAPKIIDRMKRKEKKIAVIDLRGLILNESQQAPRFTSGSIPLTFGLELGNTLRMLSACSTLSGVLIRLSTPGGTVPGSESIAEGIKWCVGVGKPVYIHISDLAASGGVWSMVGATKIIAHPHAIIGSIGVLGPIIRMYEGVTEVAEGSLFGQQSVTAQKMTFRRLYAGEGKAFGDPFGPEDTKSEQKFQALLDNSYQTFISHVSRLRKALTPKSVRELGASLMSASQAQSVGLIDEIGDLAFAQGLLAAELKDTWENCRVFVLEFKLRQGLLSRFISANAPGHSAPAPGLAEALVMAELAHTPILALSPIGRT